MLGRNYLTVDGVALPAPVSFEDNSLLHEEVNQSEAATDIVAVVRQKQTVFNFTLQLASVWRDELDALCHKASVTLVYRGTSYTGRLRRAGTWSLVERSERTENTNGLWTCPCVFTEI